MREVTFKHTQRSTKETYNMKRILIVDDHLMVGQSLAILLHSLNDQIQAHALGGMSYVMPELENNPDYDLILLDYDMPGINGLEGLKMIKEKHPNQTVGMISGLDDGFLIRQAIKNGAIGWITKSMSGEPLVHAIRLMAENVEFFPTDIMMKTKQQDERWQLFSDVEKRVAKLMTVGLSDKEIAAELNLPVKTVQHHVRFVLKKSESDNRTKFALSYAD